MPQTNKAIALGSDEAAWGWTSTHTNAVVVKINADFAGFTAVNAKVLPEAVGMAKEMKLTWEIKGKVITDRLFSMSSIVRESPEKYGADAGALFTWLHESGHQIFFRGARPFYGPEWKASMKKWGHGTGPAMTLETAETAGLTDYSSALLESGQFDELFAESFAAWVLDRETLLAESPALVEWIEETIERALLVNP